MIIAPLIVDLLLHRYLPALASGLERVLPLFAIAGICLVISVTIAISREDLLVVGIVLFAASVCHNGMGHLPGCHSARACGSDKSDCRTAAIEVGQQNGGMATGIAFNGLHSAQAAVAPATSGPWSAISSSASAARWRRSADEPSVPEEGNPDPSKS